MRGLVLLLLASTLQAVSGCGTTALQRQAMAASELATAMNDATDIARERYTGEQRRALVPLCGEEWARAVVDGDDPPERDRPSACTDTGARAALAPVRQRWARVWRSHTAIKLKHDAWREGIQTAHAAGGGDDVLPSLVRMVGPIIQAYRGLAGALRSFGIDAPRIPVAVEALIGGES